MKSARLVALVLSLSLAACSVAEVEVTTTTEAPTTTSSSSTSTTTSTTTTTLPEVRLSPVTGLEVEDEDLLDRRLMMIKIDNHPNALPQSGIDQADMVIELLVEGGFTRLITVWMESDSTFLGPNRSLRPTDYHLAPAFNSPTIVHSGGQQWVTASARVRDVHIILPDERNAGDPPATWRLAGRRSPHNLWVNSERVREMSDERGFANEPPLGPIWEFGEMPDSTSVSRVRLPFSDGTVITWDWDEDEGLWLRSQNNRESIVVDVDGESSRIGFPTLVVLHVEQYIHAVPSGWTGTALPSAQTIGSGQALVFADGMVVDGQWERDAEDEWFRLTYANGDPILIPPGQVWMSLVPNTRAVTYEP